MLERRALLAVDPSTPTNYPGGVQGWLDVTYMNTDGTFRLSRGNKGTLFVLVKVRDGRRGEGPGYGAVGRYG